jgi:hypothetical protein
MIIAPSMKGRDRIYELERHRGLLEVLVLLSENPSVSKRQIRANVKAGQEAIDRCLETLVNLRLATLRISNHFPFSKLYLLTDSGRLLAKSPVSLWPGLLEQV